jgi:hypothetical protein
VVLAHGDGPGWWPGIWAGVDSALLGRRGVLPLATARLAAPPERVRRGGTRRAVRTRGDHRRRVPRAPRGPDGDGTRGARTVMGTLVVRVVRSNARPGPDRGDSQRRDSCGGASAPSPRPAARERRRNTIPGTAAVTLTRRQRLLLGVVVNLAARAAWAAESAGRITSVRVSSEPDANVRRRPGRIPRDAAVPTGLRGAFPSPRRRRSHALSCSGRMGSLRSGRSTDARQRRRQ